MHLEADTETNGFKDPRIASISIALVHDWKPVHEFTCLVNHDSGWTMDPRATEKNGLTDEALTAHGLPVSLVLDMLDHFTALDPEPVMVCHNAQWDIERVILNEYAKAGRDNRIFRLPRFCTMEAMRDVCQLPNVRGGGWKTPSLSEAYRHVFNIELREAHGARPDRVACGRIYAWLKAQELYGDEKQAALAYAFNGLPPALPVIKERIVELTPEQAANVFPNLHINPNG